MSGTASPAQAGDRRARHLRIVKVVLAVAFAVVWMPIAIVMLVAGTSDRLR